VRSKLDRHPQPVPPIYQPELVARAIVYAADHPQRREYWVGSTTAATLLANAVAPGLLDRYLARTGFKSQQTDQPPPPDPAGNLRDPLDDADGDDYTAHGEFDDQAHAVDPQVWASHHHGLVAAGAGAVAGAALGAWRQLRR
jgi:hypothetical protein